MTDAEVNWALSKILGGDLEPRTENWDSAIRLREKVMRMSYPIRKRFWESLPAFIGWRLGGARLPAYLVICHLEPEDLARAALYAVQEG